MIFLLSNPLDRTLHCDRPLSDVDHLLEFLAFARPKRQRSLLEP